jgi:tetratricopeptide (TPR) repeat protein/tRNA A-37 threonylcarbamoyl transferase component Bud32/TolB-like protein
LSHAPASTFRSGEVVLDRFRVIRFIARGGMGEVYEADDTELGERVALKAIRPEIAADTRVNQRFRREVQLARKVTHPNICRIFDLFQCPPPFPAQAGEPIVFVTMELLEGETLAQRLKREGRMTAAQAEPIVAQMVAALSAAHDAGIVHRDFKSSNVMLLSAARPGDTPRVVVTDFGLAYSVGESGAGATISMAGELIGTPDYMAPEQIEGAPITPATDVYALGVVMYEMVTGVRPFVGDTPMATALQRISGAPPRPPRELVADLPAVWNAAIVRCLARQPAGRFADATAVRAAFAPGAPIGGRATSRGLVFAAVAGAVLVAAAASWRVWGPASGDATGVSAGSVATSTAAGDAASTPRPVRSAVAVLGFRNLAGRADVQWLSTALAEMLTTELGAGDTLRTVPGENVNRMKIELTLADADSYSPETLTRIREHLGTDLVVFGSYVAVGNGDDATLRVDIRLQDSREGRTVSLVSESGPAAGLFDLVSRAGTRLRDALGVEAGASVITAVRATQPGTSDAARLYAEGLALLRRFDALGARERLDRAIQSDPSFPLAHAALARTWSSLGYDSRARASAARAFELSSGLSRVDRLQVEGTYREMANEWAEAIGIWQALATSFPDDIEYALRLSNAQVSSGEPKDAIATLDRFRQQFPAVVDPRLDLTEAAAADPLSDFKRMEAAAVRAASAGERQGAKLLIAGAKLRQGTAALRQGRSEAAVTLFEQARRAYDEAGDRAGVARSLNNIGAAISDGPGTPRIRATYEEGLAIARAVGEQNLLARFLNNLAIQERRSGNLQASLRMNQEALAIRREIGDRANGAISLNNIGNVLLDMGDLSGATQQYEESASASREIGDRRGLARALHNAAEALRLQGQLAKARATSEEALGIRRGIDDPASVATSLFGVGQIAAAQGDLVSAKRLLTEGLDMDRKLDRRRPMAYGLYHLGDVALMQGDLPLARRQHQEALDIRTALGEKGTAAESRAALALLALEEGQAPVAEGLAREAAAVFETQMAHGNEAVARATLARALASQARNPVAAREASRAQALVKSSQDATARAPVAIAAAIVGAATNPANALRVLEAERLEAVKIGMPRFEFEARRARARIEQRSSPDASAATLAALRRDAAAKGFGLYAR